MMINSAVCFGETVRAVLHIREQSLRQPIALAFDRPLGAAHRETIFLTSRNSNIGINDCNEIKPKRAYYQLDLCCYIFYNYTDVIGIKLM